jgi:hypothetical protein
MKAARKACQRRVAAPQSNQRDARRSAIPAHGAGHCNRGKIEQIDKLV